MQLYMLCSNGKYSKSFSDKFLILEFGLKPKVSLNLLIWCWCFTSACFSLPLLSVCPLKCHSFFCRTDRTLFWPRLAVRYAASASQKFAGSIAPHITTLLVHGKQVMGRCSSGNFACVEPEPVESQSNRRAPLWGPWWWCCRRRCFWKEEKKWKLTLRCGRSARARVVCSVLHWRYEANGVKDSNPFRE